MPNDPSTGPLCDTGCGAIVDERNRYFFGKYMTERDFALEQQYFLSRRRLHNRVLHGWGVVCGLRVVPHPLPTCRDRWVVVRAGFAIDCCGRELILPEDTPFELPPPDEQTTEIQSQQRDATEPPPRDEEGPFAEPRLLCLRYEEKDIEPVPVLYSEDGGDSERCEPNRVRENAVLEWVDPQEVPGCWPAPPEGEAGRPPCRHDCDDRVPGPAGACLEPDCPCGERVPLALVLPEPDEPAQTPYTIVMQGRRHLPLPGDFLTHIVAVNWPHGGEVTLKQLREEMDGCLRVYFDRPLKQPPPSDLFAKAWGVNEHTFVVQYQRYEPESLGFVATENEEPPWLEAPEWAGEGKAEEEEEEEDSGEKEAEEPQQDACVAVFKIAPALLRGRNSLKDHAVYVTLRCDFILDCLDQPVDGTHLGGSLARELRLGSGKVLFGGGAPTGNGTPGGTFHSWFRVVGEKEASK